MNYVGIDIGGTSIKAGLVDESGAIRDTRRTPTAVDNREELLASIAGLVEEFRKSAEVQAVGIGVPGLRSSKTRRIELSPNIPCIHNLNLEELISNRLKLKVVSENDANAGAYGEWQAGAGRGLQHLAYLTIGTGLGCGLILAGALYRGATGFAGEMGHVNIEPDGRPCACGSQGCLETRVSAHGLVETAREHLKSLPSTLDTLAAPDGITAETVYDAAISGDAAALAAFEDTGRFLGIACADLINLLNLEAIVIGGGVMASGDLLLGPAAAEVRRRAFEPAARICPLVPSQLWPEAGMIGAALLARDLQ
jgi:glucokinase